MSPRARAPALMLGASLLFATMGVCVKLASSRYGAGELVMYRGLVGMMFVLGWIRATGGSLRTPIPGAHAWRSISGVASLGLWFYAIGNLPLATAVTLNYMSAVWMALFLIGGAVAAGGSRVDARLVATVLMGFVGVAFVLRPTVERQQLWHGLAGLASGVLAAMAYLQITALGRSGEPSYRTVFYFSVGSVVGGGLWTLAAGPSAHDLPGVALLLAIGLLAAGAQLMMTQAYAIGSTLTVATLNYSGIVFAFVYGALLFGERIRPLTILGIVLIAVAGIAATRMRVRAATDSRADGGA